MLVVEVGMDLCSRMLLAVIILSSSLRGELSGNNFFGAS